MRILQLMEIVRRLDAYLDDLEVMPVAFAESPMANDWRRVTKVCEEAGEVWKAFSLATGENPRKGKGSMEDVKEELGDVVMAALAAIQHLTKDEEATWQVVSAAAVKTEGRLP